jgi:hypothetical protein
MDFLRKIIELPRKIFDWYVRMFINDDGRDDNVKLEDLMWLPKKLVQGKNEPFGFIDTIQFNINQIPMKEEVIFECLTETQAHRIIEKCIVTN